MRLVGPPGLERFVHRCRTSTAHIPFISISLRHFVSWRHPRVLVCGHHSAPVYQDRHVDVHAVVRADAAPPPGTGAVLMMQPSRGMRASNPVHVQDPAAPEHFTPMPDLPHATVMCGDAMHDVTHCTRPQSRVLAHVCRLADVGWLVMVHCRTDDEWHVMTQSAPWRCG